MRGSVKQHLLSISSLPFSARDRGQGQVTFPQEIKVALLGDVESSGDSIPSMDVPATLQETEKGDEPSLPSVLYENDHAVYSFIDLAGEGGVQYQSLVPIPPTAPSLLQC